ncbi:MAG: AI-2E family transporter [archaeon]
MGIKLGWVAVLAGLIVVALMLRPFFTAIAFGAIIAFLWFPVHSRLRKKISENWSAALLTIITAAIVMAFLVLGAGMVLDDFGKIYMFFSKLDISSTFAAPPEIAKTVNDVTRFFLTKIITVLSDFASQLPRMMLSVLIFFITLFFFTKDGERMVHWIRKNIPINPQKKEKIFKDLGNYAHAFVNVWLLIGILQAVVAAAGFYLFGLPFALLAGLAAAVLSILPVIGPYALYIPVGLLLIFRGDIMTGIGLMIYGLAIGSILDYGLRPYLASRWASVHPMIMLLGIFGGIATFGPAGFIIGPMILMIVVAILKDYSIISGAK